jgi:hypothetical protein
MDKEFKDRLVKALRSGEYKQARGMLRKDDDCFCCLGVICHLTDPTNWEQPSEGHKAYCYLFNGRQFVGALPYSLAILHNMTTFGELPFIDRDTRTPVTLASLNDDGMPFSQIADLIEYFF